MPGLGHLRQAGITAVAASLSISWGVPGVGPVALSLFPDTPAAVFPRILFGPDGRHAAVGSVYETVLVGDAFTRQTELTLAGHTDMIWGLAFNGISTQRQVSVKPKAWR